MLLIHDPPVNDVRWELVKRIAASSSFQKSARLRDFLLYVCDRALKNRTDEITVQQIGWKVFGRRPDYNPSEDNIVRVEASQLRKRLDSYFAGEGRNEPVVIVIPKGTYVPRFERRNSFLQKPPRGLDYWKHVQLGIIFLIGAISLYLWKQNQDLQKRQVSAQSDARAPLWSELFDGSHETYIVVADADLVRAQQLMRRQVRLKEYLANFGPRPGTRPVGAEGVLQELTSQRPTTSMADVKIAGRIMQLNSRYFGKTSVRSARDLLTADFKDKNMILLGSTRSNPWDELFAGELNFRFEFDEQTATPYFSNVAPREGEQKVYRPIGTGNATEVTYALIALAPNLNRNGRVLIIAGAHMEGTEAAGEFITGPGFSPKAIQDLGLLDSRGRLRSFELLLRNGMMGGTSQQSRIVASRVLTD